MPQDVEVYARDSAMVGAMIHTGQGDIAVLTSGSAALPCAVTMPKLRALSDIGPRRRGTSGRKVDVGQGVVIQQVDAHGQPFQNDDDIAIAQLTHGKLSHTAIVSMDGRRCEDQVPSTIQIEPAVSLCHHAFSAGARSVVVLGYWVARSGC